jgi:arginase
MNEKYVIPQRRLKLVISKSDLGASRRGVHLGPDALQAAAAEANFPLFDLYPVTKYETEYNFSRQTTEQEAKHIKAILQRDEELCQLTYNTLIEGYTPLIFSGDHSNAVGSISGIREAFPSKKLGVVWSDAHPDFHTPFTSPSGNLHGMPVGCLLGLDNQENKIRNPSPDVIRAWEGYKKIGNSNICPKLYPQELVLLGIRDFEEQEWNVIQESEIKYFTSKDIKQKGVKWIINETINHLKECDLIFVTFDVDSLDPSISRGTGTPSANGLSVEDVKTLLKAFWQLPNLCGMEITEINPLLDCQNKMAKTVIDLLKYMLA